MRFTANILSLPEVGIFLARLSANGKPILTLMRESLSGYASIERGAEFYRAPTPTRDTAGSLYALLEEIHFDEPYSRAFAEQVLQHADVKSGYFTVSATSRDLDELFQRDLDSFQEIFGSRF